MIWNKITYDKETNCFDGLPDEEGDYIFSFKDGNVEICELCYDWDGWFLDRGEDLSLKQTVRQRGNGSSILILKMLMLYRNS